MTRELRELLAQLNQAKTEVRSMIGQNKVDEADKRMEEVRSLQKKVDLLTQLDTEDRENLGVGGSGAEIGGQKGLESREDAELETEYRGIFLRGVRRQHITADMQSVISEYQRRTVLNEGQTNPAIPDGDLSILVPKDVQTMIHKVSRSLDDLSEFVTVEPVTALSGSRVLENYGTMTPFAVMDEYAPVPEIGGPTFTPVNYKLKDRGGFLPITNNLLQDTDQNLLAYITNWIGRKAVVTRNTLITNLLTTWTKQAMSGLDPIKKVLNVGLDPAISANAVILTNQDGYDWLDTQKDSTGRYLLTDDITQPGRKLFRGRQVIVVANRYLPSEGTTTIKAPMFIGDLKQAIVLFSRMFYELDTTKEGGDAWRRRTTELRAVIRDDIQKWDAESVVFAQVTLS
ncbi:phage major capsid protein [Paenibacillus sp. RUD330]|nr:phage major capsid protein [Paenibacillus sp. RUD330]ASS66558.1 phage major capsid protein [Paenibacillus sp. RUD330]